MDRKEKSKAPKSGKQMQMKNKKLPLKDITSMILNNIQKTKSKAVEPACNNTFDVKPMNS